MSRKVREPVGMRVIHIRRGHRRITLVPIRSISLLRVEDFFTGVEPVAMAVVGKDQNVRSVDNLDVIVARQNVVQKVVIFLLHTQGIRKIKSQDGFVAVFHKFF
jgi:hypothetical protein